MGSAIAGDGTIYADFTEDNKNVEAIRYSLSKGQNHIDTAQIYGAGHTDELIGQAIRGVERESYVLATKFWKTHASKEGVIDYVQRAP